jgi:hypothetical protein
MKLPRRYLYLRIMAMLPMASLLVGCGANQAQYTPTSDEARTSLEASLTAWRDGKAYGSVTATPPVQIADSVWQGGGQIESFQIGDEETDADGSKLFPVKLKMKKPPGDQSLRYVVRGRGPVWVFREEDYKRMNNMDNDPVSATRSKSVSRRSGRMR